MKKNIARRKSVIHSSTFNKNTCGHLVTCDHKNTTKKSNPFFVIKGNDTVCNLFDEQMESSWITSTDDGIFIVEFTNPIAFNKIRFFTSFSNYESTPSCYKVSVSSDGNTYKTVNEQKYDIETYRPIGYYYATKPGIIEVPTVENVKFIRIEVAKPCSGGDIMTLGEFDLITPENTSVFTPNDGYFEQFWKSKGNKEEYLILDLGKNCNFSEIALEWGNEYAIKYELLYSLNNTDWIKFAEKENSLGGTENISCSCFARYIKLLMKKPSSKNYCIKSWRVYGEETLENHLADKNPNEIIWQLERASDVNVLGNELSKSDFSTEDWLNATVPGTVLTSFINQGAVCEFNNDDNSLQYSDNYFNSDWWYRGTFFLEKNNKKNVILKFDAINPRADIYFNGSFLGEINGAFSRKSFNITEHILYSEKNVIAVKVYANRHSGVQKKYFYDNNYVCNGGVTGFDEPCLAAGIGWDWIPTVAGRNIGIYENVTIEETGDLTVCDPWIETISLSEDHKTATLKFEADIKNITSTDTNAKIILKINHKEYIITEKATVKSKNNLHIILPDIKVSNPKLWYPAGYGKPEISEAEILLIYDNDTIQTEILNFGIRDLKLLDDENNELTIYCNGKRIVCVGGNWGIPEANYRCSKEKYEQMVQMHVDMNVNTIRNWIGQTRSKDFYNACDKFGIFVWNDFWLANRGDGPNPLNCDVFMENAEDTIKRIRNHPSVLLYCGRNEDTPDEPLFSSLPKLVEKLDPNRKYIPHSAAGEVSGFGPYCSEEAEFYFENTRTTIHSERGMTNIPIYNSIIRFLKEENRWPINDVWANHGFYVNGAQRANKFLALLSKHYGDAIDLYDFAKKSQMIDYYVLKAIFEALRSVDGKGMLLWMSCPALPSFVFQTYDYYLEQNGGYAGVKVANQPILAYLNPLNNNVELDCRDDINLDKMNLKTEIYDLNGKLIFSINKNIDKNNGPRQTLLSLPRFEDSVLIWNTISKDGTEISKNFDLRFGTKNQMVEIEKAEVKTIIKNKKICFKNLTKTPALQISFSFYKDEECTENLYYRSDDNFISLKPGESREIDFLLNDKPKNCYCSIDGYNISKNIIKF